MLELDFGAEVVITYEYESASEAISTGDFGLVTIDYQIPGGSGLDLIGEIRGLEEPPPVIMVTGHGDESIASEAFQKGVAGYVVKDGRAPAHGERARAAGDQFPVGQYDYEICNRRK